MTSRESMQQQSTIGRLARSLAYAAANRESPNPVTLPCHGLVRLAGGFVPSDPEVSFPGS